MISQVQFFKCLPDDTRRGQWVFYSLAKGLPDWIIEILDSTTKISKILLKDYQRNLKVVKVKYAMPFIL